MKTWKNIEVDYEVKIELSDYLRENKIGFECSEIEDGFYHFEIYCDEVETILINEFLDTCYEM